MEGGGDKKWTTCWPHFSRHVLEKLHGLFVGGLTADAVSGHLNIVRACWTLPMFEMALIVMFEQWTEAGAHELVRKVKKSYTGPVWGTWWLQSSGRAASGGRPQKGANCRTHQPVSPAGPSKQRPKRRRASKKGKSESSGKGKSKATDPKGKGKATAPHHIHSSDESDQ